MYVRFYELRISIPAQVVTALAVSFLFISAGGVCEWDQWEFEGVLILWDYDRLVPEDDNEGSVADVESRDSECYRNWTLKQ